MPLRSYLQFILKLILLTLNSGCVLVPSYRDYTDQDSIKCESLYCRSEMESRFKTSLRKWQELELKKGNTYSYEICEGSPPYFDQSVSKVFVEKGVVTKAIIVDTKNCDFDKGKIIRVENKGPELVLKPIPELYADCEKLLDQTLWDYTLTFDVDSSGILRYCNSYKYERNKKDDFGDTVSFSKVNWEEK